MINVWLAGRYEVLRYDVYTIEKLTMTAVAAQRSLGQAKLMVLVGGLPTLGDLTWVVGEALAGGADVIQYREKGVADREMLRRARCPNPDRPGPCAHDPERSSRSGSPGCLRWCPRRPRRPVTARCAANHRRRPPHRHFDA